jgi:Cytidylate kinase
MEGKFVITIGRQIGSGGKMVAAKLGKILNIPVYDKELIYIASRESGLAPELFEKADEKSSKSVLGNIFGFAGALSDSAASMGTYLNNDKLFDIQSRIIRELAEKESAIFVGRCADYILRDHPNIKSVFITARLEDRIERLRETVGVSQEKVEAMIAATDKKRAAYYNYYTFKIWGAAFSYDLCINSSVFGIEGTVRTILDFVVR